MLKKFTDDFGFMTVEDSAKLDSMSDGYVSQNDSRLSNDRISSGIRTSSTVVSVSSATAPTVGQVVTAINGTSAQWQTPVPSIAAGEVFYLDGYALPDGYQLTPTSQYTPGSEITLKSPISSGQTVVLGTFVSEVPIGEPFVQQGEWAFDTFISVDNNDGYVVVEIDGYSRNLSNIDTYLFSTTTPIITGNTSTLYNSNPFEGMFPVTSTDRLVIKYKAIKIGGSGTTVVTLYLQDNTNASHVHTPIGVAQYATGLQTATTVVSISASAAPTPGQVLTAISATEAEWQGPPPIATLAEYTSTLFDFSQTQTVQIKPLSGNNPVAGTWTLTGLTAVNSLFDKDGIPRASALTESGTSSRLARLAPGNLASVGWIRATFSYLPGAEYDAKHLFFEFSSTQFIELPSLQSLRYPSSDTSYTIYELTTPSGYHNGYSFSARTDGWIDVIYETNLIPVNVAEGQLCDIGTRGASRFPLTGPVITVSNVHLQQDKVSYITPARGSTDLILAQGTDGYCPVLSPDIWFGHSALVEGYGNSCALTYSIPSCTLATIEMCIWVREHSPTSTARQVYSLNGTTSRLAVSVDPTGVWSITRTNDAGATVTQLTTQPVAPVPVCLQLVAGPSSVSLYIDGTLAAGGVMATSTTATFTSRTLFGGNARSVVENLAEHFGSAWTVPQLTVSCTELRAMAYLPTQWPITLVFGQSNAVSIKAGANTLVGNGILARPGYAFYLGDNGGYLTTTGWDTDPISGPSGSGIRTGWQAEAVKNNIPAIVINCGHGGTPITSWLPSGADYVYLPATVAGALAALGTSLYEFTDALWIQGEAEANTIGTLAATYAADLTALISWIRGLYGANIQFGIHRLNEWLGPNTTTPTVTYMSSDAVRAAQDQVAATVPGTYLTRLDGGDRTLWQIHYSAPQCVEIGREAWRVRHQQSARLAIIEPDLPQRGTWSTGGYWDMEHGVSLTGTTITSWASREGTAVLTATSTPQMTTDPVGGRRIATMAPGKILSLIDGYHWGVYGGSSTPPFIIGIMWWTGVTEAGNTIYLGQIDSGIAQSFTLAQSGTTLLAIRYGQGGSVETVIGNTIVADTTLQYAVYAADGTHCWKIDPSGTSIVNDFGGTLIGVDRLYINAGHFGGQSTGDMSVRRLMIKTPTQADVLGEATELYTGLSSLY
jgi:hypothetical protein